MRKIQILWHSFCMNISQSCWWLVSIWLLHGLILIYTALTHQSHIWFVTFDLICYLWMVSFWTKLIFCCLINPLLDYKILAMSKSKAFVGNKFLVPQTVQFSSDRVKNIIGKGENRWYSRKHCGKRRKCWCPAFSPFPKMFSKRWLFQGRENPRLSGKVLKVYSQVPDCRIAI